MGSVLSVLRSRPRIALVIALLLIYRAFRNRRKGRTWPEALSSKKYDYIIAGGGTAGSVIAARLSEDPTVSVLVLEAGGEPDAQCINVPAMNGDAQRDPTLDWMVTSTPQKYACHQMVNNVSHWPRGKVLGGSSCLNNMLYVRGCKADYDSWRDDFGCDGWGYEDVLPYFKKAERNTVPGLDPKYHGTDGPLTITVNPDTNGTAYAFVEACKEVGLKNADYNGVRQMDTARLCPVNVTENGVRNHVAKCYLEEARKRPNLTVVTHAHVTRVVMDSANRATGVAYKLVPKDGVSREEFNALPEKHSQCTREVVVCGGAVHSPHILMLSGLGPKQHLEEHGIQCRVDLPRVGQNLQDHLFTPISYNAKQVTTLSNQSIIGLGKHMANYYMYGRGPLRSTMVEAMAFTSTGVRPDLDAKDIPDLQIHFGIIGIPEPKGLTNLETNFNLKNYDADYPGYHAEGKEWSDDAVNILPTLLHPKSVGEIRLKSSSAFDNPIVDPHYLEHPDDVRTLVEGLKLCARIATQTKTGKEYFGWQRPFYPNDHPKGSDAYYEQQARHWSCTVYHPIGTVAMGKDPNTSVLTPDLKVRGVSGLRVADCSIMPSIPGSNTHAPAIMVGEKCADLIKDEWKVKTSHARL